MVLECHVSSDLGGYARSFYTDDYRPPKIKDDYYDPKPTKAVKRDRSRKAERLARQKAEANVVISREPFPPPVAMAGEGISLL